MLVYEQDIQLRGRHKRVQPSRHCFKSYWPTQSLGYIVIIVLRVSKWDGHSHTVLDVFKLPIR